MKHCGLVGQSIETVVEGLNPTCPAGWIEMKGERPTPEHIADASGYWVIPKPTTEELAKQAYKQRDELMEIAYRKIRLLDSKVKIYEPSQDVTPLTIQLTAWEHYLVMLSEIEEQANFPKQIKWPQIPEDPTT